jgi:hypothetical protein
MYFLFPVEGLAPERVDSLARFRLLKDLDRFFLGLVFFFLLLRSLEESKLGLLEELGSLSDDEDEREEALEER